tara:strand:+ start:2973 stop:3473 length:501 start_codon:yes stop_codon:yes gene_type:complete
MKTYRNKPVAFNASAKNPVSRLSFGEETVSAIVGRPGILRRVGIAKGGGDPKSLLICGAGGGMLSCGAAPGVPKGGGEGDGGGAFGGGGGGGDAGGNGANGVGGGNASGNVSGTSPGNAWFSSADAGGKPGTVPSCWPGNTLLAGGGIRPGVSVTGAVLPSPASYS